MSSAPLAPDAPPLRLGILDVGVLSLTLKLAPRVEALGYGKYWLSEHHGEGAGPNPALLVPVIAGLTKQIRVGTAAVLLQFQSPLAVAENFRIMARLFPGRIDAGLGRSGAIGLWARALADGRPELYSEANHAAKVLEVQRLLRSELPKDHLLAGEKIEPTLPATGAPDLWIASASPSGAGLAAKIGARYAYSDFINWADGPASVKRYLDEFQPSPELAKPVWNVCVAGYCAESDADARATDWRLKPGRRKFVGTMSYWRDQLGSLAEAYQTDEIIVQTRWGDYNLERQVASYARLAEVARSLRGVVP